MCIAFESIWCAMSSTYGCAERFEMNFHSIFFCRLHVQSQYPVGESDFVHTMHIRLAITRALSWNLSSIYAKVKIQNIKNTLLHNPSASIRILILFRTPKCTACVSACTFSSVYFYSTLEQRVSHFNSSDIWRVGYIHWDRPTWCTMMQSRTKCNLRVHSRTLHCTIQPSIEMRIARGGIVRSANAAPDSMNAASKFINCKVCTKKLFSYITNIHSVLGADKDAPHWNDISNFAFTWKFINFEFTHANATPR